MRPYRTPRLGGRDGRRGTAGRRDRPATTNGVFYDALGPSAVVYAVVTVTLTLLFAPLAILFAFVLRLAWVAQRTATIAPFSSGRYR